LVAIHEVDLSHEVHVEAPHCFLLQNLMKLPPPGVLTDAARVAWQ
jgi:hypothetical protein